MQIEPFDGKDGYRCWLSRDTFVDKNLGREPDDLAVELMTRAGLR